MEAFLFVRTRKGMEQMDHGHSRNKRIKTMDFLLEKGNWFVWLLIFSCAEFQVIHRFSEKRWFFYAFFKESEVTNMDAESSGGKPEGRTIPTGRYTFWICLRL